MAAIYNSILDSTKKKLGIDFDDADYDEDIVDHINSVFSTLHQLGVGPEEGYEIENRTNLWVEFLGGNKLINSVKSYVYHKVRLQFDPPTTSFGITSAEKIIDEYEFRLLVAADKTQWEIPEGATAFMWELEAPNEFPPEAEEGDLGIYVPDKSVWRKS